MTGTVMTSLAIIYGLRYIDAVAAVILLETEPVYSLILSVVVVGERPSPRQLLSPLAAILVGHRVGVLSRQRILRRCSPRCRSSSRRFFLADLARAHRAARDAAADAHQRRGRALLIFAVRAFSSRCSCFVRARRSRNLRDPSPAGRSSSRPGSSSYFLSALTWYGAISRLSLSWTTALVVPGIPLISMIFAMVFLGEHPTAREVIGVLIAIGGVLALVLGPDPHRKVGGVIEAAEAIHQPIS